MTKTCKTPSIRGCLFFVCAKKRLVMSKIEKAIKWMEKTANDDSHGYDQIYRWGEKGDYDCSAAVVTAWENAGVPVKSVGGATYTGNLRKGFLACGFEDITSQVSRLTGAGLERGDVLLAEGHHVEMFCGNGKVVSASINEKGTIKGGKPGDQTGKEIRIRDYYNFPWTHVLRFKVKKTTKISASKAINYKVTAKSGLNVRNDAGTSCKKIGALPTGTIVQNDGTTKSVGGVTWYKITSGSLSGWVCGTYLQKV